MTEQRLLAELTTLRNGPGANSPNITGCVGPTLRDLCDVHRGDSAEETGRKVAATLRPLAQKLPTDLTLAVLVTLGLHPEARHRFLAERIQWLADRLNRSPNTARRRADEGLRLLAQVANDQLNQLASDLIENSSLGTAGAASLRQRTPLAEARHAPTGLLRPERQVVEFQGRHAELDALSKWVDADEPLAVGLLTGGAGAGKTRLALELCRTFEVHGWAAGALGDGWDTERLERLVHLAGLRTNLLLVVDWAETKVDLISTMLTRLVIATAARARIRILLVARSDGPWFGQLREDADDGVQALVSSTTRWRIGALLGPAESQSVEFGRAAKAFARALGTTVPAAEPDLSGPAYEDVLSLHAAALAAVLGGRSPADPLGQVLHYEHDYWLATAPEVLPAPARRTRCRQTVAAVTFCGPRSTEETRVLLRALPTFEGVDGGTLDAWVDWVRRLYPAASGQAGLPPAQLAERLVASVLAEQPVLAIRCAAVATGGQLRRMFVLAGRIAVREPAAAQVVRELLDPLSAKRVGAAVAAARELPDPKALLSAISAVIGDLAGPPALESARANLERALAIFEAVYGPDHPETVLARGRLDALSGAEKA